MSIKNLLFRQYKKLETAQHDLRYLFFEISRRCNLNCLHCGSDCKNDASTPELSLESWLKIIAYLKKRFSPLPAVVITGGEPLIYPGLVTVGQVLHREGFIWGLVSNGFVSAPSVWDRLLASGIASVTISLDGDEEAHTLLRQHPASYANTIKTLSYLARSSLPSLDVVTCVFKGNHNKLHTIAQQLIDTGVKSWRLFRIFSMGRALAHKDILMDEAESASLLDWIAEYRPYYKKQGLDVQLSCEGYVPFIQDTTLRSQPFFCRSGVNIASILSDGSITGCSNNHPDFYQGNILTDDFASIWQQKYLEYRKRDWIPEGTCRSCPEWKDCQGSSMHLWTKKQDAPAFCYVHA